MTITAIESKVDSRLKVDSSPETIEKYHTQLAEVRALLDAAIEEKGADYVYSYTSGAYDGCLYLNYESANLNYETECWEFGAATGPSCLVGHLAVGAGVPFGAITTYEGGSCPNLLLDLGIFDHPALVVALMTAQAQQDDGMPWGEAREAFESRIDEYLLWCALSENPVGSAVRFSFHLIPW